MKKFLAIMLFATSAAVCDAACNTLLIRQRSGAETPVRLHDGMTMNLAGGNLSVSAPDGTEISTPVADIAGISFVNRRTTGISDAVAPEGSAAISCDGASISVDGARFVGLYDTGGRVLDTATGSYRLTYSSLTPGLYVLKIDNQTFKIATK